MTATRASYAADPALLPGVLALMSRAFGYDFETHEARARDLGCRWDVCSTPFVVRGDEAHGAPIAHVGLLELPLVLAGQPRRVGGMHAVCVDPAHRGRGHFRACCEAALADADARWETVLLTTDQPRLYERFGFRATPEHHSQGPPTTGARAGELRPLAREPGAVAALGRLLHEREPLSRVLGVAGDVDVFAFDAAFADLRVAGDPERDDDAVVLAYRVKGDTVQLLDVVARRLPALALLLDWLPAAAALECWFATDRYPSAAWRPRPRRDGDVLMVRGPWPPEPPCALPELARC